MRQKQPNRSRASRCRQGHPFTPENTYTYPDGRRECRTCKAAKKAKWQAEHPDAAAEQRARWRVKNSSLLSVAPVILSVTGSRPAEAPDNRC